ncbi:hypothetical protein HK405_000111 [Cladochytrium tenue]|nr:hypothetical protein HK405_000111 [Cladochytrium tenue]
MPFSANDNPILSVLAVLATTVKPDVAQAAARAAVTALKNVNAKTNALTSSADEMNVDEDQVSSGVKKEDGLLSDIKHAADEAASAAPSRVSTPLEKAGAVAFGAAAAKAASIAAKESLETRRLTLRVLDLQVQKITLKLKHFDELEDILDAERAELDRDRAALANEREQLKREREALRLEREHLKMAKESRTDFQLAASPQVGLPSQGSSFGVSIDAHKVDVAPGHFSQESGKGAAVYAL